MPLVLRPLLNDHIASGEQAVIVILGSVLGGLIVNPLAAVDQGIGGSAQPIFVDVVNEAVPILTGTSFRVDPGQIFTVPNNFAGTVTVNATSAGHRFSGYFITSEPAVPERTEFDEPFPPDGPTVLLHAIPAYLYQQYTDDDDLQTFVNAFNEMVGWYIEWFAKTNPADYTQSHIQGLLLDWVAAGLYGLTRLPLPLGAYVTTGPLNTWVMNTWPLNGYRVIAPDFQATSDDIFKRILTWHLYKDDGDVFTIRWLKRRVERFLTGVDGTWGETDETYDVSVTLGTDDVGINLTRTRRRFTGGAVLNTFVLNTVALNAYEGEATTFPVNPLAPIFKAAVDAGVLELPFQFRFVVNIN